MTDTASQPTTGRIVWFEVSAGDTERARSFYGDLFGWTFQPYEGSDYHVSYEAGGAIFAAAQADGPNVYFGGADSAAATARVRELGGEAGAPQEIPGAGRYAECTDSEGNPIGLYQAAAGVETEEATP